MGFWVSDCVLPFYITFSVGQFWNIKMNVTQQYPENVHSDFIDKNFSIVSINHPKDPPRRFFWDVQ